MDKGKASTFKEEVVLYVPSAAPVPPYDAMWQEDMLCTFTQFMESILCDVLYITESKIQMYILYFCFVNFCINVALLNVHPPYKCVPYGDLLMGINVSRLTMCMCIAELTILKVNFDFSEREVRRAGGGLG